MHCARRYFTGYGALARSAAIPPLTEAMAEALDAVHFTALRVALKQEFRVGDVQFVNNLAVLHSREGYVDGPGMRCVFILSPLSFLSNILELHLLIPLSRSPETNLTEAKKTQAPPRPALAPRPGERVGDACGPPPRAVGPRVRRRAPGPRRLPARARRAERGECRHGEGSIVGRGEGTGGRTRE
jgi:hypothetical protein